MITQDIRGKAPIGQFFLDLVLFIATTIAITIASSHTGATTVAMSSKAEKAFNKAFNKVDAKAKTKFAAEMKKVAALRERADAIEAAARKAQSAAFQSAMNAGNRAAWDADR